MSDDTHRHQHYPKWLYHKTEGARVFQSPAEIDAAGPGWTESPAETAPPPRPLKPSVRPSLRGRKRVR